MFIEDINITLGQELTFYMSEELVENFYFYIPALNDSISEILINFDLINY